MELLARDDFYVPAVRVRPRDELDEIIAAWAATKTVAEAVSVLQDHQVPSGPVASLDDMLASPQLAAPVSGHTSPVPTLRPTMSARASPALAAGHLPGCPAAGAHRRCDAAIPACPGTWAGRDGTAPDVRNWPAGVKPLAGVRVVEFTIAWAGPLVCRMLGDLGADVIKIEHPTARGLAMPPAEMILAERGGWEWGQLPGPLSRNGIFLNNDPGDDWFNRLGHWNKMNRSKRGLCLDLKASQGRDVLRRLVATADIVVNNYSPRGVRSAGITPAELREMNPGIVTLDMSGFGATGPDAERISWGPVLDAASGLASTTGYSDSGPYKQGIAFPMSSAACMAPSLHWRHCGSAGAPESRSRSTCHSSRRRSLSPETSSLKPRCARRARRRSVATGRVLAMLHPPACTGAAATMPG